MFKDTLLICACLLLNIQSSAHAQTAPPAAAVYDAELAKSVNADERGMRSYVLVVLKAGPNKMPPGEARDKMFQGHFANIQRWASDKKLVLAGPFDGVDGWRGAYIFATADIEQAKAEVITDPVVASGEMVAEYHKLYASAALMLVNDIHNKIKR